MTSELQGSQFSKVTSLLGTYTDYPVVNAVIEGSAPGRVFVDQDPNPRSAFVLTNAGFSYLLGSPQNPAFNQALAELLKDKLFTEIQATDDPSLIFYPLSDGWEKPLKDMLTQHQVYDIFRKQFTLNRGAYAHLTQQLITIPNAFTLRPINLDLLDKTGADTFPWDSPQVFLEKGLGFWVMSGEEVVCECRSVFAGGSALEIDIHTVEQYRRQGLATIAASAFIAECLVRGLRPNWECWWDNEASISLAKKLGFDPTNDHPVYLVELT